MSDLLANLYPWTKSLHVVSVISWMAGLFYLPRLFVRHTESVALGTQTDQLFQDMEMKLFRVIMRPAMMSSWLFGICLVFTPGVVDWGSAWSWIKAFGVIGMTFFHFWCDKRRMDFVSGNNRLSGRQYRLMNEVPTVLMLIIVFMIIAKPF
ncbi:protoporphyrinogen oxidase HemJ [Celeribacter marinus]|uniref:protoporphyrinogen oxidase HemJ n=1 Tax=Celeribacter marinus TaxID=1397108 RepID=UPI00316F2367